MIVGMGFDLEDIADFGRTMEQSGKAFLNRVYTEQEIEYCQSQPHSRQSYAARYCAKEAAMKALGIAGMDGLKWRDIEVVATTGAPQLRLTGVAAAAAKRLRVERLLVSLSHSRSTAGAIVVAEAEGRAAGSRRVPPKDSGTTKAVNRDSLRKKRARS
jgi:holo-[acyl-carrier protein] synthase